MPDGKLRKEIRQKAVYAYGLQCVGKDYGNQSVLVHQSGTLMLAQVFHHRLYHRRKDAIAYPVVLPDVFL